MKIILSRKGFDSSKDKKTKFPKYGGYPSPILPDGEMMSLPIPLEGERLSYNAITAPGCNSYADIIEELCAGAYIGSKRAHLDPDLVAGARPRQEGWLPVLGQNNKEGKHLDNQGVKEGDLFLFFGWFRRTKLVDGQLHYRVDDEGFREGFHAIFGYMEIGEIIRSKAEVERKSWLHNHPHAEMEEPNDRIYVATPNLSFRPNYPGGGVFQFGERLRLTKKYYSKSKWNLDREVFGDVKISRHPNPWKDDYFQSTSPGQEFVIKENEAVTKWAWDLVRNSRTWGKP